MTRGTKIAVVLKHAELTVVSTYKSVSGKTKEFQNCWSSFLSYSNSSSKVTAAACDDSKDENAVTLSNDWTQESEMIRGKINIGNS